MNKIISSKTVALTFGVLVTCFAVVFYAIAWQEPTATPPGNNAATPLNISSTGQIKIGNLVVNALGISGASGNLFSMPTGAGTGKVLTSNATGVGTWQAPSAMPVSGGLYGYIKSTGYGDCVESLPPGGCRRDPLTYHLIPSCELGYTMVKTGSTETGGVFYNVLISEIFY